MKIPRVFYGLGLTIGWGFAVLGVLYPAYRAGSEFLISPSGVLHALVDPTVLNVAWATILQAACSVAWAALVGLPLGFWISGDRGSERWLALPGGVPTVVVASAWAMFFGRASWSYSFMAVVSAHAFLNAPWIALRVSQARGEIGASSLEAAQTLGAGPWARFRFLIWPAVRSSFGAAAVQVFVWCSMSFTLVKILGGGPPVDTMETLLYSRIRDLGLDFTGAMACAIWQVGITFLPWLWIQTRSRAPVSGGIDERASGGSSRRAGLKQMAAVLFLWPYLGVLIAGVSRSLHWDAETWAEFGPALGVSFRIAALTAILTLVVATAAVLAGKRRAARVLWGVLILPGGLSTLVLALALWLTYGGSEAAWVSVQALIFLPLALRVFWSTAQGVQKRLLDAAATLGASPWRAFRWIEWPRWRAPVAAVTATVLAASLGEVAAASLFANEANKPLPLLMARWMWSYRFAEAETAGALLLLAAGVATLAVFWAGSKERWVR